jgi:hypothetical protein
MSKNTIEPQCPYCGHIVRNSWELPLTGTDDEIEHECGK